MALWAVLRTKRHVATLIGVAALSLTMAAPAFAENDAVNTSVSTSAIHMTVTSAGMSASYGSGSASGNLTLTVDDPRELPDNWSTNAGWYVTMQVASDFVGTGSNTMTLDHSTLEAATLDVTVVAGQGGAGTPTDAADHTTLGGTSASTVLSAAVGQGNGLYSVDIQTEIALPANARPDTYTSTLVSTLVETAPV